MIGCWSHLFFSAVNRTMIVPRGFSAGGGFGPMAPLSGLARRMRDCPAAEVHVLSIFKQQKSGNVIRSYKICLIHDG